MLAGIDEAGRGPLAGSVFAAAVILPSGFDPAGIADSKRLSEKRRLAAYERIVAEAVAVGVGEVNSVAIDQINILRATYEAMLAALAQLGCGVDGVLVDGRAIPRCPCPQIGIVHGDALCLSISAASIVAKVERDRYMCELDAQYPGYGFAKHKGYCTPEHLAALRRLGPCPEHRTTFAPVAAILEAGCLPLDLR
jgi:ribonuclease HII